MRRNPGKVTSTKTKTSLDQCVIEIDLRDPNSIGLLLREENKNPFSVEGLEDTGFIGESFTETDFSRKVQRDLNEAWDELMKEIEELDDYTVKNITLRIVLAGPHILPIFQFHYSYNDGDYGNMVYLRYAITQQQEDCYCWPSGTQVYNATAELRIKFNLKLEKQYIKSFGFKHIECLWYAT